MSNKEVDRRNVFKLSGNMALGGGVPGTGSSANYKYTPQNSYNQEDINAAKNSLQLLKAKQQQKRSEEMFGSDVRLPLMQQRNPYPQYGASSNTGSTGSYSNIKNSNSDWKGIHCIYGRTAQRYIQSEDRPTKATSASSGRLFLWQQRKQLW